MGIAVPVAMSYCLAARANVCGKRAFLVSREPNPTEIFYLGRFGAQTFAFANITFVKVFYCIEARNFLILSAKPKEATNHYKISIHVLYKVEERVIDSYWLLTKRPNNPTTNRPSE